jgi:hypothetical protein
MTFPAMQGIGRAYTTVFTRGTPVSAIAGGALSGYNTLQQAHVNCPLIDKIFIPHNATEIIACNAF